MIFDDMCKAFHCDVFCNGNEIDPKHVKYLMFKRDVGLYVQFSDCFYIGGQHLEHSESQLKKDIIYLGMASLWAQNSHCKRSKVGTLVVKDNMIIADGYNGTPRGFDNSCEDENNRTLDIVLHAESNAITKLSSSTMSSIDATLYTTLSPCVECSKLIHQSKIKEVVFSSLYRDDSGLRFLMETDICLKYINKELVDKKIYNVFDI